MKRVFIVPRWGKGSDDEWYLWLKGMLEKRGLEVHSLQMPDKDRPHINTWVPYLRQMVGTTDRNTYFIGHSVGCQTIIRYLESIEEDTKAGGAVFVAGWFHLKHDYYSNNEEKEIGEEWMTSPVNLDHVKSRLLRSTAIYSKDDPYVPVTESEIFRRSLGSKIIIYPKRGHFTKDNGSEELHVALNELLNMVKENLVKD